MASSMASQDYISKLPNELLLLVLEKFANKRDLKSHVLVSRKFHDIARPLVYRECTIGYSTVPILTEDVTLQPNIAKNVQVLNITAMDMGIPAPSLNGSVKPWTKPKRVRHSWTVIPSTCSRASIRTLEITKRPSSLACRAHHRLRHTLTRRALTSTFLRSKLLLERPISRSFFRRRDALQSHPSGLCFRLSVVVVC